MAVSLTVSAGGMIDGKVRIRFGKNEREFDSLNDLRSWARSTVQSASDDGGHDILLALLVLKGFRSGNVANIVGRTITADLNAAANIVRVT